MEPGLTGVRQVPFLLYCGSGPEVHLWKWILFCLGDAAAGPLCAQGVLPVVLGKPHGARDGTRAPYMQSACTQPLGSLPRPKKGLLFREDQDGDHGEGL